MRSLHRVGGVMLALLMTMAIQAQGAAMGKVLLKSQAFPDEAWQAQAQREEIRPAFAVDAKVSRTGRDGSLRIACTHPSQYGGWTRRVGGVQPGTWYRFDAYYRAEGVTEEARVVLAWLDWRTASGARERMRQPDYVYHTEEAGGGWKHVWTVAPAPETATSVELGLFFGWRPGGTVWWDEITLAEAPAPAPRPVRVAALHHYAKGNTRAQANVEEYCAAIDRAAEANPDLIVLPEAMTAVGTELSYLQVAEPIPGPTSERLGEKAREHHCYLVACYNEREGNAVYNTAVLIDRQGKVVGKYRKCYLPREEIEAGLTPGNECPVFQTDFGTVGMMICWDVAYVEVAQRLALQGAELILMPIWDGDETLMKARAAENHVYLATSAYGNPSQIFDPTGKVLATTERSPERGYALAEIDLSQRPYYEPSLGDTRARFFKEHRGDLR